MVGSANGKRCVAVVFADLCVWYKLGLRVRYSKVGYLQCFWPLGLPEERCGRAPAWPATTALIKPVKQSGHMVKLASCERSER